MRKQIRLLMDCDNVLANFTKGALEAYNRVTGRDLKEEDLTQWYFTKYLEWDNPEQKEQFDSILHGPGFALNLEPMAGSIEAVEELRHLVDLHIVTSPLSKSQTWVYEREAWLDRHYLIDDKRVHHSGTKWVFSGDLFVDDKPENVSEWQAHNPGGVAFLWSTHGNKDEKELPRLSSWDELLNRIRGRRCT